MYRPDNLIKKTCKKAAAFGEGLRDLVLRLWTSKFAFYGTALILALAVIAEFSIAQELFREKYIAADGAVADSNFWRAASKAVIVTIVMLPLKQLWWMLDQAAGGDWFMGEKTRKQEIIGTIAKTLHWTLFLSTIGLVWYVQANMGLATFSDLAALYQGETVAAITPNDNSAAVVSGNSEAAQYTAALWPTLIVSGLAASLAYFFLERMFKRKEIIATVRPKIARCDRLPQLLEQQATLHAAREYINSPEYSSNLMFAAQSQYRDAFYNGLREARAFLNDGRDLGSKIVFEEGQEHIGERRIIPGRTERLAQAKEAEKALKAIKMMSADATGRLIECKAEPEDKRPEQPVIFNSKMPSRSDIHKYKRGGQDHELDS